MASSFGIFIFGVSAYTIVRYFKRRAARDKIDGGCDGCDNGMAGSVKSYDRHVVICVSSSADWPSHIEELGSSFPYSIIPKLESHKSKKFKVKVTACHHETFLKNKLEVIIYPENLQFELTEDELDDFCKMVTTAVPINEKYLHYQHVLVGKPFMVKTPAWKKLILVCEHGQRDKRCGRAGPQVIAELRKLLLSKGIDENEVTVRGSSHIGGHKFAGTLICYPEGVWYGKVSKSNTKELLDNILNGDIFMKCLRGKVSSKVLNW